MGVYMFREWEDNLCEELIKLRSEYEKKFGRCPYTFLFDSERQMIEKLKSAIKTGIKLDFEEDTRY